MFEVLQHGRPRSTPARIAVMDIGVLRTTIMETSNGFDGDL
jgi:hypothetical protein